MFAEFQESVVWWLDFIARNVPFYAYRVRKFLAFSNRIQDLGSNLRGQKFLNYLKSQKKIADWKV